MSSNNEPTWKICRKAVWMLIQNVNNLADAEALLNQQENDLHIASGKCFILLLVNKFWNFLSLLQYIKKNINDYQNTIVTINIFGCTRENNRFS
jgi:hypothetical protein